MINTNLLWIEIESLLQLVLLGQFDLIKDVNILLAEYNKALSLV